MAMQERLEGIRDYLNTIDTILTSIKRAAEILHAVSSEYSPTLTMTDVDKRHKAFVVQYERIQFTTLGKGNHGAIFYLYKGITKCIPPGMSELGETNKNETLYVNLDDLLYIAYNLNTFMNIAISEIIKNEMSNVVQCVNQLKESAIADLL